MLYGRHNNMLHYFIFAFLIVLIHVSYVSYTSIECSIWWIKIIIIGLPKFYEFEKYNNGAFWKQYHFQLMLMVSGRYGGQFVWEAAC